MLEWPTILEAIGLAQTGDRMIGRQALLACWEQTDLPEHAFRCVLAHYLADVEDSVDDEVAWDTTALAEYAHLRGADLAAVGIPDATGLAPSLHLNLGDGFLRQGRTAEAAEQLSAGLEAVAALGDDGYGRMIRDGLDRLASRIDSVESSAGR
ncbi:MAG TPA: hypothetical protein VIG79_16820 [Lapillicoccus sp.]|jgi:hypothetical protein|uniref:hypothetical protein n=1 Tax=Lapillicoccus sp. TaxID=1909287 RepID=UPI002F95C4D5